MVVLTEWEEFRWLDFAQGPQTCWPRPRVVDARNLLDPTAMRAHGLRVRRRRPPVTATGAGSR